MLKVIGFIFLAVLFVLPFEEMAQPAHNEVEWSKLIAAEIGGETEVRTPDGSRVDIVAKGIAWEVDWCTKKKPYKHWEAPSQATFGAAALNLKPGVMLLFDGSQIAQESYLKCLVVCSIHGIRLETWKIN